MTHTHTTKQDQLRSATDGEALYKLIATAITARANCERSKNLEWFDRWSTRLQLLADELPSGSGVDSGTQIDLEKSTGEKIVLTTAYHHMHESGMYDGWTEHTITIKGSLCFGFTFTISGRDRNGIKEYLTDLFHAVLTQTYTYTE